jgi:hypothetical protein
MLNHDANYQSIHLTRYVGLRGERQAGLINRSLTRTCISQASESQYGRENRDGNARGDIYNQPILMVQLPHHESYLPKNE